MNLETLDLHGEPHHKVDSMVENFVLLNETPLRIITGNSVSMKNIVSEVLERHDLRSEPESHWNLGSLIVYEAAK